MVRLLHLLLLVAALLSFASPSLSGVSADVLKPQPAPSANYVAGRFILVADDSITDLLSFINTLVSTLLQPLGVTIKVEHTFTESITGFAFSVDLSAAKLVVNVLKANPLVAFIVQDQIANLQVKQPCGLPQSYATSPTPVHESQNLTSGETVPNGVRRIRAANSTHVSATPSAAGISIAVLDTGIDLGHPDLPSAVEGVNCVSSAWRIQTNSSADDHGHGTHVAGTIAAANNGAGIVGVAPGARLFSVKVADQYGQALISDMMCGFEWVIRHNLRVPANFGQDSTDSSYIQVATMSIGAPGADDGACGLVIKDALHLAVCATVKSGVSVVASAGNNNLPFATFVPAAYPEVLTVTAFTDTDGYEGSMGPFDVSCTQDLDDSRAAYSNFAVGSAAAAHTVAAPGTCIYSTYLRSKGSDYTTLTGTSMAAPHVAGTVALCYMRGICKIFYAQQNLAKFVADATAYATQNPTYGAVLDPVSGIYGPLVAAELY